MTEGRGAVNTEAGVMVTAHPSFRGASEKVRVAGWHHNTRPRPNGWLSGADVEPLNALDDRHRDVCDRAEPVAVGQDLLRQGHESRALGHQEAHGVDQV